MHTIFTVHKAILTSEECTNFAQVCGSRVPMQNEDIALICTALCEARTACITWVCVGGVVSNIRVFVCMYYYSKCSVFSYYKQACTYMLTFKVLLHDAIFVICTFHCMKALSSSRHLFPNIKIPSAVLSSRINVPSHFLQRVSAGKRPPHLSCETALLNLHSFVSVSLVSLRFCLSLIIQHLAFSACCLT